MATIENSKNNGSQEPGILPSSSNANTDEARNNSSEYLLEVKDLKTYFYTEEGVVKAVDGVSFEIKHDQIMGLVGETGCGKSVTALSILKLIRSPGKIVSGQILFNGEDLVKKSEEEIRHYRGNLITMIFQDPMNSLNPVMKVGDQIAEVFLLHQMDDLKAKVELRNKEIEEKKERLTKLKAEVKELNEKIKNYEKSEAGPNAERITEEELNKLKSELKEKKTELSELKKEKLKKVKVKQIALEESAKILKGIGIPDSEDLIRRYPHELSGGMRQRIMIAMGLACNSQLLICDEPTTALDVTIQAQILELIRSLKMRLHNSVLFITHDLGVIHELCDKVAVMYAGNIVEYGDVEHIFEKPMHPYTIGLINSIPRVKKEFRHKKLSIIPGMVPNLIYPLPGCKFHPRCPKAMQICQREKPSLIKQKDGRKVACHLFNEDLKKEKPELFKKLTDEEKRRFEY
ncbi:MAG: ABC transporter ATP-binding protein [Promethearchaeota archaeon]